MLKMKAALFAIKIYGKNVYNSLDHTKIDNPAKLDMQPCPKEDISGVMKSFWNFYHERNIWVGASYIETNLNKVAGK